MQLSLGGIKTNIAGRNVRAIHRLGDQATRTGTLISCEFISFVPLRGIGFLCRCKLQRFPGLRWPRCTEEYSFDTIVSDYGDVASIRFQIGCWKFRLDQNFPNCCIRGLK
jgi:hypothetical protein